MVQKFAEFIKEREGADKFGAIINDIMMVLRNYKTDSDVDTLKVPVSELKLDLDKLDQLKSARYNKLVSFNFSFLDRNGKPIEKSTKDGFVLFTNLNNSNKSSRPWENLNNL